LYHSRLCHRYSPNFIQNPILQEIIPKIIEKHKESSRHNPKRRLSRSSKQFQRLQLIKKEDRYERYVIPKA